MVTVILRWIPWCSRKVPWQGRPPVWSTIAGMYLWETGDQQAGQMEQHSSFCCQQLPLLGAAEDMSVFFYLLSKQAPPGLTGSVKRGNIHCTPSANGKPCSSLLNITPEELSGENLLCSRDEHWTDLLCDWSIKSPVCHRIQTHGLHKGSFPSTCAWNFTMEFSFTPSVKESHCITSVLSNWDNYCQQTPITTDQPGPHHGDW